MSVSRLFLLISALVLTACGRSGSHSNGVVVQGASACAECHLSNYQATTVPSHAVVGYPTTCADCHVTSAWRPAVAGHVGTIEAAFPINSGKHTGIACVGCHNSALAVSFKDNPDCTTSACHLHDHAWFSSQHADKGGTWSDTDHQFCRQCHPKGGGAN